MSIAGLGIVLLAAALPAGGSGPTAKLDVKTGAERILAEPASYDRAATDPFTRLTVNARCSEERRRASDITLGWSTTRAGIRGMRVDISKFRDGFATGKLVSSVELAPGERTFEFLEGKAGTSYYWRLLARTEEGWVYAGNGRFDAPICPSDDEKEDE